MKGEAQPTPDPAKKNNTVLWVVLAVVLGGGCFVCVILAAILFPVFSQARSAAMATQSMSNLKVISTSIMVYITDYDDRLPRADDWQTNLEPYHKNPDLFVPPYAKDPGGYAFNSSLSEVFAYYIPEPSRTPMVFETSESGQNLSGGVEILRVAEPRVCIGVSDSSVRRLPVADAKLFDWKPKVSSRDPGLN